jgi:lipid II:glycine glycyltransferase (peptidoglycan interpeptide bridge formation enzyme)
MSDQLAAEPATSSYVPPCEGIISGSTPAPTLSTEKWKAWDAFIETRPATGFMQSSWWVDFRYTCGFENFGITLTDGEEIVGGAVVLRYSFTDDCCFYYIQDGPVLPQDPEVAEEIFGIVLENVEERRKNDQSVVSHLRIEPRWLEVPSFVKGFRNVRPLADYYLEARDTRCIDLRPSEAAMLAQMKSKGRYNIGVARRHGVSIVEDASPQGLADFYGIYEETTERQGIAAKPADYFEALVDFFSPGRHGSIFFAEYEGARLATVLVIYFGPRATYFYGGSRDLHRHVMAPYLLHFEIMRKAKALGHQWYDLWGIAPPNEPDHPWQNFTAFKAKFGGEEVHLVPTLDYVYDDAAYEEFGELSGRNG